jgi:purine-nucleoside phosphorylase
LPNGIFSNQKFQFGLYLEGLEMEDVGIFYGRWVYFKATLSIVWISDKLCGHLVNFSRFGMLYREKSGNPAVKPSERI